MSGPTGSDILAYTPTYGDRLYLKDLVPQLRGSAGLWFDWFVATGAPSKALYADAEELITRPDGRGIQHWLNWKENRGQHAATREALALAKKHGYKWLLRLDDDITAKSKDWLKKMIDCVEDLKRRTKDNYYRIVAAPKIVGLQNQLPTAGTMTLGQPYTVDVMHLLGGACRLHPMELMEEYEPNVYDPLGRGDPQQLAAYLDKLGGIKVRFPAIRMVHRTADLEAADTPEQAHQRAMAKVWPALGAWS